MATGENVGVSEDPFFGVVRRRHPDIDIVLLPPDPPTEPTGEPAGALLDPADLADVPAVFDAELTRLWDDVADGIARPDVRSRWTPGSSTGSVAEAREPGPVRSQEPSRSRDSQAAASRNSRSEVPTRMSGATPSWRS